MCIRSLYCVYTSHALRCGYMRSNRPCKGGSRRDKSCCNKSVFSRASSHSSIASWNSFTKESSVLREYKTRRCTSTPGTRHLSSRKQSPIPYVTTAIGVHVCVHHALIMCAYNAHNQGQRENIPSAEKHKGPESTRKAQSNEV